MLKSIAKHAMLAVAPQATTTLISARARAHSHRLVRDWGLLDLNRRLIERFGSRVQSGPFCGMSLSEPTQREHLGPFLLGTYEAELHPWIEQALRQQYRAVLDIGAKFGYYAVGLARQCAIPVSSRSIQTRGHDARRVRWRRSTRRATYPCPPIVRRGGSIATSTRQSGDFRLRGLRSRVVPGGTHSGSGLSDADHRGP